jgi:hypothetical protein
MEPTARSLPLIAFKPDEQLYLKFVYDTIKQKIVNKISPIFIAANSEENEKFLEFVKANYQHHIITDPNYSIRKTLRNVWTIVKNELDKALKSDNLENEKLCQSDAYREIIKQGQMGKVLTVRQAKIFIYYAQSVSIFHFKNLIGPPLSPLTADEKLYLQFVVKNVRDALNDKCTIIFLGASEKMKSDFLCYAKEKKVTYTKKNLNFLGIINAVTYRFQMVLKEAIDPLYIMEEERQQKVADAELLGLNKICKGRMLTKRQAEILINFAK